MKRAVVVKFQFEGLHCWKSCPLDEVKFLRDYHRHMFHVTAMKEVDHNDRDIEIILLKRNMLRDEVILNAAKGDGLGTMSCEDICEYLMGMFKLKSCTVLEDGENGAYLWNEQ